MPRLQAAFSARFSADMYINDSFQLNILLYSVGFGFFAAFLYDVFNTIHLILFKSSKSLFAKDVVYVLTSAFLCFIFILAVNSGKIRVYIIIGIILGYICWFMSLSSLFLQCSTFIAKKIITIITTIAVIISYPFRLIFSLLTPIITKTNKNLNIFFQKSRNKLKIHLKKK